jgi:chaperonin GroES
VAENLARKVAGLSHFARACGSSTRERPLDSFPITPYVPFASWHSKVRSAKWLKSKSFPTHPGRFRRGDEVIMAKLKFRPLHDRVVVKRVDAEEKSKGGIIIPDTAKEKPQEGEIVAVGPGGRDENGKLIVMGVKAGDRVLFGKWSGTEVKLEGDDLLIMKESDIMGVIS